MTYQIRPQSTSEQGNSGKRASLLSGLLPGLVTALLIGCAASPMVPKDANADDVGNIRVQNNDNPARQARRAASDARAQIMYEILIAELAFRRGLVDIAADGYFRAAQRSDDVQVLERATRLAVWAQKWDMAEQAAQRWLELDPTAAHPREVLAQIQMESGSSNMDDALEQFVQLVESNADKNEMLLSIYILLAREPDRERALEILQGLRSRFPNEVQAHLSVGRMQLELRNNDAALEAINQGLSIDPEHGESLLARAEILSQMGKPAEGLDDIRDALAKDADNIALRAGYARLLASIDRYDDAMAELDILFKQAPNNSGVLLSIGLIALDSKRTAEAKTYFDALLETGERNNEAHFYLARINDQQQNLAYAINHYEQVGESDYFVTSQIRAAELYGSTGQVDVAIQRLRSLANVLPDQDMQTLLIATESRVLQDAGQNQDALDTLSNGLEKYPDNGDLRYARALAAERTGNSALLQSDLRTLIEAEPDNASALNALGYFLADDNANLTEADGYLTRALELRPDDPAIMDSVGWLRFRQGDSEAALTLLQRAYALLPDGEIAAHIGEVMWVTGDKQGARRFWSKALLESPEDTHILETMERLTQ